MVFDLEWHDYIPSFMPFLLLEVLSLQIPSPTIGYFIFGPSL